MNDQFSKLSLPAQELVNECVVLIIKHPRVGTVKATEKVRAFSKEANLPLWGTIALVDIIKQKTAIQVRSN